LPELPSLSGFDGPPGPLFAQRKPVRAREVEQRLALLAFLRDLQEKPCEQADRQDASLDHHHAPREALVLQRRDAPMSFAGLVEGAEGRPGPYEDVAEQRTRQTHGEDVPELCRTPDPARGRHRPEE